MLEISPVIMKRTSGRGMPEASFVQGMLCSGLSLKRPPPQGLSFSAISLRHRGWVKSPVPISVTPLILPQWSRCSKSKYFEVAREKRECTWKSAMKGIEFQSGLYQNQWIIYNFTNKDVRGTGCNTSTGKGRN